MRSYVSFIGPALCVLLAFPYVSGEIISTLHLQGVDGAIAKQITQSMTEAVRFYNENGVFDKRVNAYYKQSVPTAEANWDGTISFGTQRNTRVAFHEIAHTLGIGQRHEFHELMRDGKWAGAVGNAKLSSFDGPNSVIRGDRHHFWPYGFLYDPEDSPVNRKRHVEIVQAMRCDMKIGPCDSVGEKPAQIDGRNRAILNRATGKVMSASGNGIGSNVMTSRDQNMQNQRWRILAAGDKRYMIISEQAGQMPLETWNFGAENGTNMALNIWYGDDAQRFFMEEVEPGWYRIKPVYAPNHCVDESISNANVLLWQCWGGQNQMWAIR